MSALCLSLTGLPQPAYLRSVSYYYVPGMVLYGTVDYLESETGALNVSSGAGIWNDRIIPIVAVNAVDGSNIELYIN